MKSVTRLVLTTGFMLMGMGAAAGQAPVRPAILITEVPPPTVVRPARSPVSVTDRLASFDANADHLISHDELPERMQGLVARGDKNADGSLDSDEIRVLVNAASSERTRISIQRQPSDGLPGVIADLKLAPEKHARALEIVSAHKLPPHVKEPTSGDLYRAMSALLDSEEYENFSAAAARLLRNPQFRTIGGTVGGLPARPVDR